MRSIDSHIVPGDSVNHQLRLVALDGPGPGGASHEYEITFPGDDIAPEPVYIAFQNGPIAEAGVNGLTHEVLLAVLIDRIEGFQAGPYACEANEVALASMLLALKTLQLRTRERIARGVEGTHVK